MSEKRFEIIGCTVWMVDEDGEEELWNPQIVKILNKQQSTITELERKLKKYTKIGEEQLKQIIELQEEIKRLEKMIWKIQWRFQQEVGIEKAREHYQEIDKEMEE